jgi:uncharacterized protein
MIGRHLDGTPGRQLAFGIAASLLLADYWLVWSGHYSYTGLRVIPPPIALVAYLLLSHGDLPSVGLRARPIQGPRYWAIATLAIGAAIGAFLTMAGAVLLASGRALPVPAVPPTFFWSQFLHMCVMAPVIEEAIYRAGFCTGAVGVLGERGTIAASGIAFGALHVLYGNPGPDNLIAGFFLAWAYLKGGTILVPIALHSLGNTVALLAQVAAWYWRSAEWA